MGNEDKNMNNGQNGQEQNGQNGAPEKKGLIQKAKDGWNGFKEKHPTAAKVVIGVGVGALAIGGGALAYNAGKKHGIAVGTELGKLNELPAPEIPTLTATDIPALPETPEVNLDDLGTVEIPDVSEL